MKRVALALAALVIALAACEFRFEVDLNDDGSGRFSFLMAIEKQFISLVEQLGGGQNPFDKLDELERDLPPGFDVRKYDARGLEGFRIGIPFKDVEDLKAKLREFSQGFAQGLEQQLGTDLGDVRGGVTDEFRNFTLTRKPAGGWRFRIETSASAGLDLGGAVPAGFDVSQLAKLIDIQLRVTLPGDPMTNNATSTERKDGKTTFAWKADPTSTERVKLVAETKPSPSSFPVVPVAAGAGGALALAAAAFAIARRGAAPPALGGIGPAEPPQPPEPPVTP